MAKTYRSKEPHICKNPNCGKTFFPCINAIGDYCSNKCIYEAARIRKRNEAHKEELTGLALINDIARKSEHKSYGRYTAWLRARFRPDDPKKHFGF